MKLQNGILWYLILIASVSVGFDYPTETERNEGSHLFRIGRNRDANEIMYDINLNKTGNPDNANPITIYWVKKADKNRIRPLTWIQNKFAYGGSFWVPAISSVELHGIEVHTGKKIIETIHP